MASKFMSSSLQNQSKQELQTGALQAFLELFSWRGITTHIESHPHRELLMSVGLSGDFSDVGGFARLFLLMSVGLYGTRKQELISVAYHIGGVALP